MEQADFGDFSADSGEDRPDAEAVAVAGDSEQSVDVYSHGEEFPEVTETLDISVTQVDYTIAGSGADEHPILHVFGRDDDHDTHHVRVYGFRPYFYTSLSDLDLADDHSMPPRESDIVDSRLDADGLTGVETHGDLPGDTDTDAIVNDEGDPAEAVVYESIRGEDLLKVFGRTPRDVGQLRDRFEHYEADILFPNRLLIDKDIRSGIRVPARRQGNGGFEVHHTEIEAIDLNVEPRVHTLDIEVDDRHGFPEEGEETIVCLTSHDSYRDEYVVWLYESPEGVPGPEAIDGYDPIDAEAIDVGVRGFSDEGEMLEDYLGYVEETDPDLLSGWNFDDFDAPYLLDRIERLESDGDGLDIDRLSRVNEVWRSGWGGPNIKGRVVFDLLYAYQRTKFSELDSYRLDAVGEEELGVGKERYPGDIGDLWEDDPEQLLEYNLRDVELCVELNRKQGIVPFWQEVASFVGCKLEDATTPGDAVDMYVLHKIHGDFALPSKGAVDAEEYEGGAVFDPISGVREMVSVLDLKCFSDDTDVATPDGIRNIEDIEIGDPVYTLDPETFECEIKPVVDTQSYENKYGELHHIEGNTHDFKITENHRFLLSKTRGWEDLEPADYEFDEYRNVPDAERFAFPNHEPMSGVTRERFSLVDDLDEGHVVVYSHDGLSPFRAAMPSGVESELDWANGTSKLAATTDKTGKYLIPIDSYRNYRSTIEDNADEVFLKYDRGHAETPTAFDMDDWLELIGWFVTEGSFTRESPGIVLHQHDEHGRESIRTLLERMNLQFSTGPDRFKVSNHHLYNWLIEHCGDGYAEKRLPEWVFELDASHLRVLLETLIDGDGSRSDSGLRKFWTKSDQLKEDIVRLAVRCGEKPTATKQSDGTWYVSIGKQGSMKKANATVEPHDGQVHCLTAKDNHVVLAGRNGHLQWVGQSLYPMCMVTINASPETKVDPESYGNDTYVAPNGTHFRKQPDGMIREMVDELLEEREEKKGLRNDHDPGTDTYETYDRQQAAVKVIMNSLYGVLGWDRFRLYDKEMGAAVTATGRDVIEFTEEAAGELNKDVIYGDTDSVMLELGHEASKQEAIEQSFEIEDHINSRYDEFAERLNAHTHRFEIEFEKLYRRFFQAGKKKRYAGNIVWKEGKDVDDIDITGFEYQRSDIAPITKEVQREVLEMIVTGEETDDIVEYVREVIERVEVGDVSVEEIGIPGGIGKRLDNYDTDTAQVRGAKYANEFLGTNFDRGSKPKRLYLRKVHPEFFRELESRGYDPSTDPLYRQFKQEAEDGDAVICFEFEDQLPDAFEIDYEKMLEKTLQGPIERILEALDITWQEVRSGQEQTGLESFM
ncbi:MAG: DNA polymerase domain-containing protein [Natronomonas sp.]